MQPVVADAQRHVEKFFGARFAEPYEVRVLGSRAELDDFTRQRWGMEKTECWMVAMGVSSLMVVLSPYKWPAEACEHEATDAHIREIVTHEMVHVFHGQHNPSHEFNGTDEIGWFIEGLATHVAGQLDENRLARLRRAVSEGRFPGRLVDVWSGEDRYGLSGSLVRFIEHRWGRAKLRDLLGATTNAQILESLALTEKALLDSWRASLQGA